MAYFLSGRMTYPDRIGLLEKIGVRNSTSVDLPGGFHAQADQTRRVAGTVPMGRGRTISIRRC
jgi:hypothetical protein